MIADTTLIQKPICEICKEKSALVGYRFWMVCGDCCLKMNEKEKKWMEEQFKYDV